LSRRSFLGAAGSAGLGSLLIASGLRAEKVRATGDPRKKGSDLLPRRKFGRTGVEVSIIAMGSSIDLSENQLLLSQGLKRGVTYWDTADSYSNGASEEGIGLFFGEHPEQRKNVFLVTKSGAGSVASVEKKLSRSLERMKTGHIDLYFFHGVNSIDAIDRPEFREWAEKAKKAKKIRFIGLSTHKNMAAVMTGAAKLGWLDGLMTAYNYRIMHDDDMKKAVDSCVAAGLGVTAMKTQGGGPINDTAADRELAGHLVAKGFTPEQAKIKAVLEDTRIAAVCSQMPSVEILRSNVAAVLDKTALDAADRKALDRHAKASCAGTCAACGRCEKAVAGRVPVADVMRNLMYSRGYGEHALAREYVRALPAVVRGRMKSMDFSRAERACPNGLPITRLMKEAILELA